jgi:hypothetical protein
MDTNVFCVYNLARGVFLSSKVTVADCANEPLKMLKVLVSGLGLDAVSGLWLSPLYAAPLVPRLFPFDLLYLDGDHQVVDASEIAPGVEFPPFLPGVASALLLAHQTLQSTQTARGDRLIIGLEEEIERQINAWATPSTEPFAMNGKPSGNGHSGNGHRESKTSGRGEAASSRLMNAVFTAQVSPAAIAVPENGALVAQRPEVAKAIPDAKESLQVIGGKITHSYVSEIASKSPTDEAESSTPTETPVISITEVVLDRPRGAQIPVVNGQHGYVEDLFSNWVDAPSSASAWIARNGALQGIETDISAPASVAPFSPGPEISPPPPKKPEVIAAAAATAKVEASRNGMVSKPESAPANKLAPMAIAEPTRIAIPQAPLATTFTSTQYGLWRVSMPTTSSPVVAVRGPHVAPPGASVPYAQSSNGRETAGNAIPAEMVKAPGSNAPAKGLKASEKIPDFPIFAKAPQEKTHGLVSADLQASVGQVSTPAAADIRPLPDVTKSTARQSPGAEAAAVVPDKVEIPRREVPAAETGNPAKTAGGVQKKPVDSKTILPAKAAALKQPDDKKGPTSTPQSELSTVPLPGIREAEQTGKLKISIQRVDTNGKTKEQPPSLGMRFKRWLNPVAPTNSDRRKAHRRYVPGMVAHYYTGGAPKPHDVADISMTGLYLLTEDRWMPDTMIQMTLQKPCAKGERKQSITVLSKIVRRGSDGVAAEFVMPESLDPHSHDVQPSQTTDRFSLARFL